MLHGAVTTKAKFVQLCESGYTFASITAYRSALKSALIFAWRFLFAALIHSRQAWRDFIRDGALNFLQYLHSDIARPS